MQQLTCNMVWSFSFYSLEKRLDFKRKSWGKKCEKVPKRFCPLSGPKKPMTATDVTGFDAIFSTGFFATFSRF